jgi:aspartate oxidase
MCTLQNIRSNLFVLMNVKTNNVNIDSNRSCDVLIIGGGSAGLRAAIEAHDAGAHVLIISKSKKADPHTVLALGKLKGP